MAQRQTRVISPNSQLAGRRAGLELQFPDSQPSTIATATCDLRSHHPQAWRSGSLGAGSQGWLSAVLQEGQWQAEEQPTQVRPQGPGKAGWEACLDQWKGKY